MYGPFITEASGRFEALKNGEDVDIEQFCISVQNSPWTFSSWCLLEFNVFALECLRELFKVKP